MKWFDRKFDGLSKGTTFPSIVERLRGTPVRLEEKIKAIPPAHYPIKLDNTWSIKENIGHLFDLEPLWQGRLEDILNKEAYMRPTDLGNAGTELANHNEKDINELLRSFRASREQTVMMLEKVQEAQLAFYSLHPRLNTTMNIGDLFYFVAEHDDHHLSRIQEIKNGLT